MLLYHEIVEGKPIDSEWAEAYEHGHDPAKNTKLRPYLDQWRTKIRDAFSAGALIEGQPKAEIAVPASGDAAGP